MKSEIRASILIGLLLALLVSCTCASPATKLTDFVESKGRENSDQRYFVAGLVEAQGGESVQETAQYIESLQNDLQTIYNSLPKEHGEESLAQYVDFFKNKLESLDAKVASRFEELVPKLRVSWFDDLRSYLLSLKAIIDDPESSSQCSEITWTHFVQTMSQLYGQDVDQFISAKSKEYFKFQAFLLQHGRQTIKKCAKIAKVQETLWREDNDYEDKMDALLSKYGKIKRQGHIYTDSSDQKLHDLAKGLDLVDGPFDGKRMLDSTPKLDGRELDTDDDGTVTFDQFYEQFHRSCGSFNGGLGYFNKSLLNSLQRLLLKNQRQLDDLSTRERKLLEYKRLYEKFCSADKAKIAANFERNKSRKPESKCKKFFCGLG